MPVKQFDIENRKKKNNSINDIKKKKKKLFSFKRPQNKLKRPIKRMK